MRLPTRLTKEEEKNQDNWLRIMFWRGARTEYKRGWWHYFIDKNTHGKVCRGHAEPSDSDLAALKDIISSIGFASPAAKTIAGSKRPVVGQSRECGREMYSNHLNRVLNFPGYRDMLFATPAQQLEAAEATIGDLIMHGRYTPPKPPKA